MNTQSIDQQASITSTVNDWAHQFIGGLQDFISGLRGSSSKGTKSVYDENAKLEPFQGMPIEEKLRLGLYRFMD